MQGRNDGSIRLSVIPIVVFKTELSLRKQNSRSGCLSVSPTLEEVRLETCGETSSGKLHITESHLNLLKLT